MELIKLNKLPEELDEAKVYVLDDNHLYALERLGKNGVEDSKLMINFIKGGRHTDKCVAGITSEQLVEVVLHRAMVFEDTFKSGENVEVIEHLMAALSLMNDRTIDRHERGVLGNSGEDYKKGE